MTAEDFVAYPSRWRIALLIVLSLGFVAAGAWMAGLFGPPPEVRHYPIAMTIALGWSCIALFGLATVAWTRNLFDGRERLRIGRAGIRRRSGETIPWSEIKEVTTFRFRRQRFIVLHLRDPSRFVARRAMPGANRTLSGGDIDLSLTGTDRSFNDAMEAIERFRKA